MLSTGPAKLKLRLAITGKRNGGGIPLGAEFCLLGESAKTQYVQRRLGSEVRFDEKTSWPSICERLLKVISGSHSIEGNLSLARLEIWLQASPLPTTPTQLPICSPLPTTPAQPLTC